MGGGRDWYKNTTKRKWIYLQELNPANLSGGVVGIGNSVLINKYTDKEKLQTFFYCIIEATNPTEARFEALREFIRFKTVLAYLLKIGIIPIQDMCMFAYGLEELDRPNKILFEHHDYVVSTVAEFFKPNPHNSFLPNAQELYKKLTPIDKYIYQAGEYLNLAYYLKGFLKESVINFNKVVECLIYGLNRGKKSMKLNTENINMLKARLKLNDTDIIRIKKLSQARDDIAAHGIIDPELEYIIGQYNASKRLSKYFVVTCGPNYGLGDLLGSCENSVRKVFANYIGINF